MPAVQRYSTKAERALRWVYRHGAFLRLFGPLDTVKLLLARFVARTFTVKPRGYRAPIKVRGRTPDVSVLYFLLLGGDYPIPSGPLPKTVLDGGAYAGHYAVFMAHHCPDAKIIAVEPDPDNFALVVENTRAYPNVTCIKAALSPVNETLWICNPKAAKWAIACQKDKPEGETLEVDAVSIETLCRNYGMDGFELVKLNIEGGEKRLFASHTAWLAHVRWLFIELHGDCESSVYNALTDYNISSTKRGDNHVIKIEGKKQHVPI